MQPMDPAAAKAAARAGLDQILAQLRHLVEHHDASDDDIVTSVLMGTLLTPGGAVGVIGLAGLAIADLVRCQIENARLTDRIAALEGRSVGNEKEV